jgi:hypothetical protein
MRSLCRRPLCAELRHRVLSPWGCTVNMAGFHDGAERDRMWTQKPMNWLQLGHSPATAANRSLLFSRSLQATLSVTSCSPERLSSLTESRNRTNKEQLQLPFTFISG